MLNVDVARTTGTNDNQIIALMRFVLAAAGLLIVYIDPAEPRQFVVATYTTLTLYTLYSVLLYILSLRPDSRIVTIHTWSHWPDVAWYGLLIALSNGTSSIFFFGFLFAILAASFRWGFASGLRVTVVATILFTGIGVLVVPSPARFEVNRFLLRPTYLLVLGYLMAYWGGYELQLKHRLALLKQVATLSNPRFGIDHTIGTLMERLRVFFNADTCIEVTFHSAANEYRIRRTNPNDPEAAVRSEVVPAAVGQELISLPPEVALVFDGVTRLTRRELRLHAFAVRTGEAVSIPLETVEALVATFEAPALVSVPLDERDGIVGRLLITRARAFEASDAAFLSQVMEQVTPVLNNIRLVDRLASDAADQERKRIARDLHDSVIQPYIGLKIGLGALQRKIANEGADIGAEIERLLTLADDGIADLRGYVSGLKRGGEHESGLVASVQRFGTKFAEVTGIDVQVEATTDLRGNDRLAAEIFQMIAEGLSNIRRHTHAARATINLARQNGTVQLRIENDRDPAVASQPFMPRSMCERVHALGGTLCVEHPVGTTAVIVKVPL